MPSYLNTNIASLTAQLNLNTSQSALNTAIQRLSSGLRINSAADDAAGYAIAQRMTAQINGLNQAVRNANDGVSLAQTAQGALSSIGDNLQRLRELAVESANATNSTSDRQALQTEANQITAEITRVATQTQFNGINLLDGTFTSQAFQVGANANQTISITSIANAQATALGSQTMDLTGSAMGVVTAGTTKDTVPANGVTAQSGLTITTANGGTSSAISWSAGVGANTIASDINSAAGSLGVTATATNSVNLSNISVGGTIAFTLNGSAISATGVTTGDYTNLLTAINGATASTGVSASFTTPGQTNEITLTTADGSNISLQSFTDSGGTGTATVSFGGTTLTDGAAANSAVATGNVSLSSSQGTITTAGANTTVFASAAQTSSLASVASVDLSTASGAQNAISIIDAALATVDSQSANLGAYQNRFTSTVTNLQSTAVNLTQARSVIQDTNFASETAVMTQNQILQQAGTAMLAQANALPNSILTLLRG